MPIPRLPSRSIHRPFRPWLETLEDRSLLSRTPLVIIPGQPGSFPAGISNPEQAEEALLDFAFNLGPDPASLTADFDIKEIDIQLPGFSIPITIDLTSPYSTLIHGFEGAGYKLGVDLFVATADWRLPTAPLDGSRDGTLSNLTASLMTDGTMQYGVDYLGYWLDQVNQAWSRSHPGVPTPAIDVVSHSYGNVLGRAYVGSPAYGGAYTNANGAAQVLPRINHWVMLAPPNEGVSIAYNWLKNNYFGTGSDLNQGGLYDLINLTFLGQLADLPVTRADGSTISGVTDPIDYIQQYIPSFRTEVATYAFLDGKTINDDPLFRNDLMLDLNGGPDPNAFAGAVKQLTTAFGSDLPTPSFTATRVGPDGDPSSPDSGRILEVGALDFTDRPVEPGETWFRDVETPSNGDLLVPKQSAISTLAGDPRAVLWPVSGLTHNDAVTNPELLARMVALFNPPGIVTTGAGFGGGPQVRVFDAATSALKTSFFAFDERFGGGVRVAVADVNRDGIADYIAGAGPSGGPHVKVFSGADLSLLHSFMAYDIAFRGGVFVAGGDVNGDGFGDIVTGADAGGGPHVRVFSGRDGSILHSFMAYDIGFRGGVRVAAGDVNGDGNEDITVGPGPGAGPDVRVFDGQSASLLRNFFAFPPLFRGGVFVAAGDVDGDGYADIIAGADEGGSPVASVFKGPTAEAIASFFAFDPAFRGGVRVSTTNSNGRADIVTAAGPGAGPYVRILDGLSFATLRSLFPFDLRFRGGVNVG